MDKVADRKFDSEGNKEVTFTQKYNYRFQSDPLAPIKHKDGSVGKPRFSVEDMLYVSSVGLEIVDPLAQNNEFIIAFINYVRMKEQMGYQHTGKSSDEMETFYKNLWGVDQLG